MTYTITDRTIAISAIYQAVQLVQQIANIGTYNENEFETCIQSIFRIDTDTVDDVYGGTTKLTTGLQTLIDQLSGKSRSDASSAEKDLFVTKYAINVMILEKQLRKNPAMLKKISDGINNTLRQVEHFSVTHDNVIASLAHLYTETISNLKPRIMVHGEQIYISNPTQANRIRALLLAAIRAAVLWRQCGGNRWQLLLNRSTIIENAKSILASSKPQINY